MGDGFWDGSVPDSPYEFAALLKVEKFAEQGESYSYSGINAFVMGWLVEKVMNMPLQDAITREFWSQMGAEADAAMLAPRKGVPNMHGGLMGRMRDLSRFGLLFTPSRKLVSDEQIISERYLDLILNGGNPKTLENSVYGNVRRPDVRHSVYVWTVFTNNDIQMSGWAGQGLLINPEHDYVAVWTGYMKDAKGSETATGPIVRKLVNGLLAEAPSSDP